MKTQKNIRMSARTRDLLRRSSELTGMDETAIIEVGIALLASKFNLFENPKVGDRDVYPEDSDPKYRRALELRYEALNLGEYYETFSMPDWAFAELVEEAEALAKAGKLNLNTLEGRRNYEGLWRKHLYPDYPERSRNWESEAEYNRKKRGLLLSRLYELVGVYPVEALSNYALEAFIAELERALAAGELDLETDRGRTRLDAIFYQHAPF